MNEFERAREQQKVAPVVRRRRHPIGPFVVAGFMLPVGSFVFAAIAIPISVPNYAMSPGPVSDVSDFIQVV